MEMSEPYLRDAYSVRGLSTYQIAEECNTYPNKVSRALTKYGIQRRSKSVAQANALKQGRHGHPTKGTRRSDSTKVKISESMAKAWSRLSDKEKQRRIETARKQWEEMSAGEKEVFKKLATEAVRVAATEGSKLERFLLIELNKRGYHVYFHAENVVANEDLQVDLFLPQMNVAIEIDGPAHFYPIWGEENLAKHLLRDNAKTGLLLQAGYVLIRVKHLVKTTSKLHERNILTTILDKLESIKAHFPPEHQRLIEIEVK